MRLTAKFLIAFISIAILSIGSLGFLSYKSARSAIKELAIKDMTLIGDAVEGQFYCFLDSIKGRALDFSSDGFIRSKVQAMQAMGPSSPRFKEIQQTLGTYLKQEKMPLDNAVKLMLVIGLNGRVIAATSEQEIDFDELRDSYFTEAKKDAFISDVHITHHSDGENIIYIAVSAPIKNLATGELLGVLVNFYSSRELNKMLTGEYQLERGAPTGINSRGQTFDIYLVNREKQLITPSIYSKEVLSRRVDTLPVAGCASGRETSGLYKNFMGLEVIGASMCMPSKGWTLLTEMEADKAFAAVTILRAHVIEAGLVILLLSAALAYLIASRITRPLRSLAKVTNRIAEGDFCIYTDINSRDEIGDLARSLNEMVSRLEESQNTMQMEKARLEALLNGMADSVIFVDAKDKSVIINTAAKKLLDISGAEEADHRLLNSRHIIAEELSDLEGLFTRGNLEFYSAHIIYKQRGFEFTVYPVKKDNTVTGTVSVIRDVTERMSAEEALHKSKEQLHALIDNINALIFLKDLKGRFILANQKFAEQFNTTKEALTGKTNYDIFPRETADAFEEKNRKVLESGAPAEFEELFFHGGKPHIYISALFPLLEAGAPYAICGVLTDITYRKMAEVELKERHQELEAAHEKLKAAQIQILQQDKMASIGQLAAGVAHEINNPVGFIMSNLGSLQKYLNRLSEFIKIQAEAVEEMGVEETLKELKEQRKALKIDYAIEDSVSLIAESLEGAERVKRIVQDLKSFSRIDESENKMADLNDGIERTINIIWNELKYKVTLKKEFGDIPLTKCNMGQLNQVFMNILVNAAHAIEKQGDITIKTWYDDNGYIQVAISDTGSGIPEDKINRIFEPFFTTKEVGKGTGLGLSIAYDIIKKHNGDITVESRVGEGTTFIIKIPVVKG